MCDFAQIEGDQIAQIGSQVINIEILLKLSNKVNVILKK